MNKIQITTLKRILLLVVSLLFLFTGIIILLGETVEINILTFILLKLVGVIITVLGYKGIHLTGLLKDEEE